MTLQQNDFQLDSWDDAPLSIEELTAAKRMLFDKMSFLDIMRRYSAGSLTNVWGREWTHKCTCPHHKHGAERTPSFFFSETSKKFYCFACSISGDIFDLIALMENRQWWSVVRELLGTEEIDPDQLELHAEGQAKAFYNLSHNINQELSIRLRDYLVPLKSTTVYQQEADWVDWMFKRIDDRLDSLDNSQFHDAQAFKLHLSVEVQRRLAKISRQLNEIRNNR